MLDQDYYDTLFWIPYLVPLSEAAINYFGVRPASGANQKDEALLINASH